MLIFYLIDLLNKQDEHGGPPKSYPISIIFYILPHTISGNLRKKGRLNLRGYGRTATVKEAVQSNNKIYLFSSKFCQESNGIIFRS